MKLGLVLVPLIGVQVSIRACDKKALNIDRSIFYKFISWSKNGHKVLVLYGLCPFFDQILKES